jgi:hypothetical protein
MPDKLNGFLIPHKMRQFNKVIQTELQGNSTLNYAPMGGLIRILGKMDLSRVKIRLDNIRERATKSVSFVPTDVVVRAEESYPKATLVCLEDFNANFPLNPSENGLMKEWSIFGYDESTQDFRALEGDLMFCSSSIIKIEDKYVFNLAVLPYFLTSIKKFKGKNDDEIRFTDSPAKERNMILINAKTELITKSVEDHSIVLIDGPLVGGMASSYMVKMDEALRKRDCIPLYFVKNSDSRLVIDHTPRLSSLFNSDFHWAAHRLETSSRSPFFRYTDMHNLRNCKVFAYVKALAGFPERIEMHSLTYEKYRRLIPSVMDLMAYFYLVQGDYSNPQVRPIAIAEKYAREGLKILNIPALLVRLGFHPTINQVRFG